MSFRGNQNRSRNFGSNYGGAGVGGGGANRMAMNMSPWDTQTPGGNFGGGGGNMRQGVGGQGMNAQALNLANNLLNNLFRNQNPPSLLDLPRGGGGMGNRNQRGGQMINRGGGGNRMNNRRIQGGFPNRGASGVKSNQKPGAGGIRKQNAFDRAKKLLAKNANNKKKEFTPGDKKPESKESPYANVPNDMFYCHLCKKHMWDANSFENHIKGRTHLMMREGIEESYRLKANMIRQEAKIAEQLKSIELDRLKRMGKTKQRQLEYCTMCDLNFHGHISAHRKSEGHLQLKKFLHPKCIECNKEFATRIDYDSHLLSADHLIKAAEKNTKVGERKRNTLAILTEDEEVKDIRQPQKRKKKPTATPKKDGDTTSDVDMKDLANESGTSVKNEPDESGEQADKSVTEDGKEGSTATANDTKEGDDMNEEEDVLPPLDPEDCIVDYTEGDEIPTEVDNRLPKYNWMRAVGFSFLTKVECYECSLCGKFFDTEKTGEIHARTVTHHRNFLKFINEKSSDTKIAQKRAAAAIEESERKRRRMEEAEETKNGLTIKTESAEDNEQGDDNAGGDEDNGELYDPSEATGEEEYGGENGDEECLGEEGEGGFNEYEDDAGCEADDDEMDTQNAEQASTAATNEIAVEPEPTPEPAQPVVTPKQTPQPLVAPPAPSIKAELKPETAQKSTPTPPAPTPTPIAKTPPTTPTISQSNPTTPVTAGNNSTPGQNQSMDNSAKKGTPRGGGTNKATRARGRGRYSRY